MKFDKLIELRKLINNICDNYTFDEEECEKFNKILDSQITAVNELSELTMNALINNFGKCEPPKE